MGIRLDIWWSELAHRTFRVDNTQSVAEVITEIRYQLGDELDESDAEGKAIEYALFKVNNGHREPLVVRSRTLSQLRIVEGQSLFLANLQNPWWNRPNTSQQPKPHTVFQPQPDGGVRLCLLQLTKGCMVTVPSEGLQLDRTYLLTNLPQHIVYIEKAKMFAGIKSRLHYVRRSSHCELFRQGDYWLLRANDYTYINNRTMNHGATTTLAESTTIVLGRGGWPLQIHLSS